MGDGHRTHAREGLTMGASNGNLPKLKATEQRTQAMQLRLAGATYEAIAQAVGYSSRQAAYRAIERARLETLREPADALREMELMRLERLQQGVWPAAIKGDHGAVDRVLRIMERRAKLLGLDAPVKQEVEQVTEVRVEFVDAGPAAADAAAE
jgi:uncharacterized protein YegP (UPF0339 family)